MSEVLPFDDEAVEMTVQIERSIIRLDLDCQGEFVALINALQMQIESGHPVEAVVGYLTTAMVAWAEARGVDHRKLKLAEHLEQLRRRLFSPGGTR